MRVLYAGNLGRAQALHRILPDLVRPTASTVQWRVIGNGPRAGELSSWINNSGAHNIEMLEPVNRERLVEHYRWADVLFLHLGAGKSNRRAMPSKIFEYAATGKPILAGVSGAARRLIEREVDGAFCFAPECVSGALQALERIERTHFERSDFCMRYDRNQLADQLVRLVMKTG